MSDFRDIFHNCKHSLTNNCMNASRGQMPAASLPHRGREHETTRYGRPETPRWDPYCLLSRLPVTRWSSRVVRGYADVETAA